MPWVQQQLTRLRQPVHPHWMRFSLISLVGAVFLLLYLYVKADAATTIGLDISTTGIITTSKGDATAITASGTPPVSSTASLVQLGSAIASGSANGTFIGVNAASGYSGNLLDLQVAGSRMASLDATGKLTSAGGLAVSTNLLYVDTATGSVGIGTATASGKLEVSGGLTGKPATGGGDFPPTVGVVKISNGGIWLPNAAAVNFGNAAGSTFQPILTRASTNFVEFRSGAGNTVWTADTSDRIGIGALNTSPSSLVGAGGVAIYNATPTTGVTSVLLRAGAGQGSSALLAWANSSGVAVGSTDATGNLTLAGDLAVNGNDLTSTGALTIQPAAGSNLNVNLSTTGDLAVNTNQLYMDTSTGNVGIGTSSPSALLHVATSTAGSVRGVQLFNTSADPVAAAVVTVGNDAGHLAELGITSSTSSGVLGQGTGSVAYVRGSALTQALVFTHGSQNQYMAWTFGLLERMRLTGAGNFGIGTTAPQSALHVPDGKYAQFEDNNAGAPPAADCDADAERGRLSIDTTNNRLYICNGATRGWDFILLTD